MRTRDGWMGSSNASSVFIQLLIQEMTNVPLLEWTFASEMNFFSVRSAPCLIFDCIFVQILLKWILLQLLSKNFGLLRVSAFSRIDERQWCLRLWKLKTLDIKGGGKEWNETNTDLLLFLLAQSAHLFLHTCASPHTPTDGVARIFSLTPMPQLGIELTSPLWGTLTQVALPTELLQPRHGSAF